MTARSRLWTRGARRWLTAGVRLGAAATLGLGCRSADPAPEPPARPYAAPYPGLPPAARTPVVLPDETELPPSPRPVLAAAGAAAKTGDATAAPAGPPPAAEETLDLGVALRLAGVGNPTVSLARERIREALADQLAAQALLLPSVNVGGNFYLHRGTLQASSGAMREVNRQSIYLGFGARAVGSGTVGFPGVWLFAHLGDAAYEPLAARQRVAATRSDALAVENTILLDVAAGYLGLVGAEARLGVLRRGETELAEIVRLTRVYAEKGQGRAADANRATANAELLRRQVREAEEGVAVASARLCRLLNLDPALRLRTPVGSVQPFRLVPEDTDAETLVAEAVRSRPELFARSAEILEARTRARQERVRPWVPVVAVGYSGGLFGGGSNLAASDFGPLRGRSDFDAVAAWNVENLGLGNRARARRADAVVGQALAAYGLAVNQVRQEVAAAVADAQAAARQIEAAKAALGTADEGFGLELRRIRQGGPNLERPIETLDSFRQLLDARQEWIRAVVAFDVAQFRLFVATGSNRLTGMSAAECPIPVAPPASAGP